MKRLRREGKNMMQRAGAAIKLVGSEIKKYDFRTYLFDLDFNLGDQNLYTVDAAFYGNLSHFINHRSLSNLIINYNQRISQL